MSYPVKFKSNKELKRLIEEYSSDGIPIDFLRRVGGETAYADEETDTGFYLVNVSRHWLYRWFEGYDDEGNPVDEKKEERWFKLAPGITERPGFWNGRGKMDFMLDGKPHGISETEEWVWDDTVVECDRHGRPLDEEKVIHTRTAEAVKEKETFLTYITLDDHLPRLSTSIPRQHIEIDYML